MKTIYKKPINHQPRGIAMILVLITLAMATVLGLTFLNTQATTTGIAQNVSRQASARGIAESAMEITINHIRNNANWRADYTDGTWVSNQSLNGGTFTIAVNDGIINNTGQITGDGDLANNLTDNIVITATGYFNGVTHTVRSEITPTPTSTTPQTRVLMVVPNPGSLSADDLARQTLLESWNMTVTLIDDSSSQSTLSAAYASADVVYVSQNATDSTLGGNLLSAPIGVITEQISSLVTNMGLAQSVQTNTQSQIDIQDNTHYITSTFDIGLLSITSSNQSLSSLSGSIPSGLAGLAHHASNNSVALGALNAGETLNTGASTPARRVVLPWGSSNFSPDSLTADGKTLLKRALIWGGNSPIITNNNVGLAVSDRLKLEDNGIIDSFDSTLGAYNSVTNAGQAAIISTNDAESGDIAIKDHSQFLGSAYGGPGGDPNTVITVAANATLTGTRSTLTKAIDIPVATEPTGMPANQGDLSYDIGTTTITGDIHCNKFQIKEDAIVHISGDVRILCENQFKMSDKGKLLILANSSVSIWVKGDEKPVYLKKTAEFNLNTANPMLATFYVLSSSDFDMKDTSKAYARVIAPNGAMELDDSAQFHGTFMGKKIEVKKNAQLHHDIGISPCPQTYANPATDTGTNEPQLILEYKMNEVPLPTPQLVGHWLLDETIGGNGGGNGLGASAGSKIELKEHAAIDSYNSQNGPYGGGNISSQAEVSTNSTSSHKIKLDSTSVIKGNAYCGVGGNPTSVIQNNGQITGSTTALTTDVTISPDVAAPTGLPTSLGNIEINSIQTWNSNLQYDKLTLKPNAIVTINGDITVLCNEFKMDSAQLIVPNGSSLNLYVTGEFYVNKSLINTDTQGASRLHVYQIGNANYDDDSEIELVETIMSGIVYSVNEFELKNKAYFYGTAIALKKIEVEDSTLHIDLALANGNNSGSGTLIASDLLSNHGIYRNSPTGQQAGHTGTAVQFDGNNDYLKIPHSDTYLLNSGTVSFWFNADAVTANQSLFSKNAAGFGNGGHLEIWINGSTVNAQLQSTTASYALQSQTIAANTWNQVIFSWSPTGSKLYVNGALASSNSYGGGTGTNSGDSGNYEPIVIGASTQNSGNGTETPLTNYFAGRIDEVRIYDQALDATQAANLYSDLDPGPGTSSGYLVQDTSGFGEALDLTIQNPDNVTWTPGGGLTFNSATAAASASNASKIATALAATDQLTFEVIFTPNNLTQNGPAQLASFSADNNNRNFTFGQNANQYLWQQRTSTTGNNGTPNINSASVLTAAQQHVVITWNGQEVKMYRNGKLEITQTRQGFLSSWDNSYKMFLGNEATNDRPWLGELKRIAMYDRTLNAFQVQDLFDGNTPRSTAETQNIAFHVQWYENP